MEKAVTERGSKKMLLRSTRPTRALAAGLICLLALPSLAAQEAPKPKLNIVVVEGEGAVNNIRQRLAREPIVRVEDENKKPLAGATVVFLLPKSGASGLFPNGTAMLTVTTDAKGQAIAAGLRPNSVVGQFQIRVTANYQGMTGATSVNQSNAGAAAAAGVSGKTIAILAAVGAAAAGGVIAATGGNGGDGPPPPPARTVSVTAGAPNVGAPR
jgi:hypothetical protein